MRRQACGGAACRRDASAPPSAEVSSAISQLSDSGAQGHDISRSPFHDRELQRRPDAVAARGGRREVERVPPDGELRAL